MPGAPGWRIWLVTVITLIGGMVLSVYVSIHTADENTQQSIQRARAAGAEQQRVVCGLISSILDAYKETPPPTVTGKNVANAWLEEYRIIGCLPRR